MTALSTLARHAGLAALFVVAALLGTPSGVLFAYSDDLPVISALDDYAPDTITRVLGRDRTVVGEFAVERRVVAALRRHPAAAAPGHPRRRGRRLLRALRAELHRAWRSRRRHAT